MEPDDALNVDSCSFCEIEVPQHKIESFFGTGGEKNILQVCVNFVSVGKERKSHRSWRCIRSLRGRKEKGGKENGSSRQFSDRERWYYKRSYCESYYEGETGSPLQASSKTLPVGVS